MIRNVDPSPTGLPGTAYNVVCGSTTAGSLRGPCHAPGYVIADCSRAVFNSKNAIKSCRIYAFV